MFTFAELAHMVDATQLRSRGHMLDASALMGCLGWGGVGMFTFAELAHMVDATQLRFWWPWTHAGCFGIDGMFGVGWGGDVHVRRTCTHGGCYATAFLVAVDTCWMLRH